MGENKVVSVKESSMNLSIFKKQSMLPNSTSNNTNFKFHNFITNADNKVTKCKPVTLTTRSSRSPNFQTDRKRKQTSSIHLLTPRSLLQTSVTWQTWQRQLT